MAGVALIDRSPATLCKALLLQAQMPSVRGIIQIDSRCEGIAHGLAPSPGCPCPAGAVPHGIVRTSEDTIGEYMPRIEVS